MIAISMSKVKKEYYDNVVLDGVSFSINLGDKLGLVGKNGTGKTTILRLISGEEALDSGDIFIDKTLTVGYMKQMNQTGNTPLFDFCLEAFSALLKKEKQLADMELQMASFTDHGAEFNAFMDNYHNLHQAFEDAGGYLFRSKVKGILIGLGFMTEDFERPICSLSGGQLSRLKLARLLIDEPDILLLDEPTNHLDIKTTNWLENYLKQYDKTVIIVSHDRFFIDAVCSKVMEIENQNAIIFDGNYSAFRIKKDAMIKQRAKAFEKYEKERKRQEEIIQRFKGRGTELLAKRAKSREKALAKMKRPDTYQSDTKTMSLNLGMTRTSGHEVLHVEHISKSFDSKPILTDVTFNLFKNEKIGLIGDNGSGKTTLFKIINDELSPDDGKISFGHHVFTGYYDQNHDTLNETLTIFDEIHNMIPTADESDVRTLLGRFLFEGEEVFKQIKVLSGGEKARVLLTKLFLTKANLLLLDEPTNHLDIYSKEVLEQALDEFEGTLLTISHDRYFLNKICDKIIEIEDGNLTMYHGNYDYFLEKKAALNAPEKNEVKPQSKTEKKLDKKRERERINARKKLRRKFETIENDIEETELRLGEIDHKLCLEEVYLDTKKVKALTAEQQALKEKLDKDLAEWESISEALESELN